MNHRSFAWLLPVAALLAGCDGQETPTTPAEPPPGPWQADVLKGPYLAVADFCKTLNAPACEERTDVIVAMMDSRKPITTKDGVIQLLTVASNDGKAQRAHLLFKRDAEIFALPTADEYDPKDGKRHVAQVRSLREDQGLIVMLYQTEVSSGEGATARMEVHARQAHCRIAKDFPIACALFDTEHAVTATDALTTVPEQTAEVFVLSAAGGRVTVMAHGQSGSEALKLLAAPGEYQIAFP